MCRSQGCYSHPLIDVFFQSTANLVNDKHVMFWILHATFDPVPPNDHTPEVVDFKLSLIVKRDIHQHFQLCDVHPLCQSTEGRQVPTTPRPRRLLRLRSQLASKGALKVLS